MFALEIDIKIDFKDLNIDFTQIAGQWLPTRSYKSLWEGKGLHCCSSDVPYSVEKCSEMNIFV